ncbi:hypothetical protein ACJX0J_018855, partial [Zea mays]
SCLGLHLRQHLPGTSDHIKIYLVIVLTIVEFYFFAHRIMCIWKLANNMMPMSWYAKIIVEETLTIKCNDKTSIGEKPLKPNKYRNNCIIWLGLILQMLVLI